MSPKFSRNLTLHGESEKIGLMMTCWPPRFQIGLCLEKNTLNLNREFLSNGWKIVFKINAKTKIKRVVKSRLIQSNETC